MCVSGRCVWVGVRVVREWVLWAMAMAHLQRAKHPLTLFRSRSRSQSASDYKQALSHARTRHRHRHKGVKRGAWAQQGLGWCHNKQ